MAQTRWLFCLCALASLVTTLPGALLTATSLTLPVFAVACAVLATVWLVRYFHGHATVVGDVVEALAVTVFAVTGPDPAAVFGFVFSALWFRALYGSGLRVALLCTYVTAGLLSSLPLWGLVPEHDHTVPVAVVLSSIVNMFLTAGVACYLATSLFAREQSQHRDAALVSLGQQLIGLTERGAIQARAAECARTICAATPGLSALLVRGTPDGLTVVDHAGASGETPTVLPRSVVPLGTRPDEVRAVTDRDDLAALPGDRVWVAVGLTDQDDGWILLGAPRRMPDEAIVAVQSMTNLVALAMRSSDAHQDLAIQASHDALTGLANRAAFTTAVERAVADPGGRVALLFLDLDDFKTVNDGLGHAAGDDLLRHVAARMRYAVRPDDLCARLGGDEFAVLLLDADDAAAGVAERLVELVASPVSLKGHLASVGASVGLAHAEPGMAAETLVQHADIAMYAAKAKGKNRVQAFTPGLLTDADPAVFEAEVAAAADADQLVVHYQPVMSLTDDRCVGVEALVRWQHPTRGVLGPGQFIGVAEQTGSISAIGAFVLRRTCADARSWTDRSQRPALHVNVSAAQLTDPGFHDLVRECLVEHGIEPDRLVLEITEGMVLDSGTVRAALDRLATSGVHIAVDDFGTGYSALSLVRTLPLHTIKLDKSFLSDGPSHAADRAVITAVVHMAASLGLHVVAEGVERPDQERFLRELGVGAAQGHLYLRPAPADRFASWLRYRADEDLPPGTGTVTPIRTRRAR